MYTHSLTHSLIATEQNGLCTGFPMNGEAGVDHVLAEVIRSGEIM